MRPRDSSGWEHLFGGLPAAARAEAEAVLAATPRVELAAGAPSSASAFAGAPLLLVEDGFAVVRARIDGVSRAVVTCEAAPGTLLRQPSSEEELVPLTDFRVLVVSSAVLEQLLAVASVAGRIIDALSSTLAQKQEAIATFASPRHVPRVRRKLLQLARSHGHVVRDGVRIDFPLSHALLAEMVGSSRETVTRALEELRRSGFVARSGSTYRLLVSPDVLYDAG